VHQLKIKVLDIIDARCKHEVNLGRCSSEGDKRTAPRLMEQKTIGMK